MAQPFAFIARAGPFQPAEYKIPALSLQKDESDNRLNGG
jgi:hypothetical protein